MAKDTVGLLERLFGDINARAPFGVAWKASAHQLPMQVEVTPADHEPSVFILEGSHPNEVVVQFAKDVQEWLTPRLGSAVPRCPNDGSTLVPRLVENSACWVCPGDDFQCEIGDYLRSQWPPEADDPQGPGMLATRLSDHGIGWINVGFVQRDGPPVVEVALVPGEDEAAVRALLAPFPVDLGWGETPRTERFHESSARGEFRGLRLRDGRPHWLAGLTGPLDRPQVGDDADILIRGAWVRLAFEHRLGGVGEPLLQEADGTPFADVGDIASCAGGVVPASPVDGERQYFWAWQILIKEG